MTRAWPRRGGWWAGPCSPVWSKIRSTTYHRSSSSPRPAPKPSRRHRWLVPDYAAADGTISLRVQAFVIEVDDLTVLVDPCVGNGKTRALPFWHDQSWPFLERLAAAGFSPDGVDLVVHTHLHADHVGWDTRRARGTPGSRPSGRPATSTPRPIWPTSGPRPWRARTSTAIRSPPSSPPGWPTWSLPDADLGHGLRLEPSPGHTPGHVSLWLESDGEQALITGDFLHHPVQFAEPDWAEIADADAHDGPGDQTEDDGAGGADGCARPRDPFLGPTGRRVVPDGERWRFQPA